ncbi:MAG TPA: hypothetical protein VHS31_02365 [Tepidisphaeraceae bacterium]|jgi:hypothetical protein|nr:hypothetical protein [Tepidisphaeraceae bacterium]
MVNEALEVLREQEQFTPEHEAYLRQELQRGVDNSTPANAPILMQ